MDKVKLEEPDLLEQIRLFYDEASKEVGKDQSYLDFIREANSVFKFRISIMRDNGKLETLEAYRVQHSFHYLPCKGGFRLAPDLSPSSAEAFAFLTTIKMGFLDVPFGGSFGGVRCNPKEYSANELERIVRRYMLELSRNGIIGPSIDVLDPDMGVDVKLMGYMKDTYQQLYGNKDINAAAVCTCKPSSQGGIEGRDEAWGLSVYRGIQEFLALDSFRKKYGLTAGLKDKKIILQGLGKIGYWTGKFLAENEAKIVGVILKTSSLYDPEGLNFEEVAQYYKEKRTLAGYTKAKECHSEPEFIEVMYKPCDILVLAAKEKVVDINNVDKLNTKVVAEAASLAVTYFAQKMLDYKGVAIIPDFILNVGGTVVSYFEWLKDMKHVALGRLLRGWEKQTKIGILGLVGKGIEAGDKAQGPSEKDIVFSAIEDTLHGAVKELCRLADEKHLSLRTAGYKIAIERIKKIYEDAGFII